MRVDPMLVHYPVRIREVTIGVILGISFIFYTLPRFLGESEKIEYDIVQEIETFDIPHTEQIKLPEPPGRPSGPVASEDECFDDEITSLYIKNIKSVSRRYWKFLEICGFSPIHYLEKLTTIHW